MTYLAQLKFIANSSHGFCKVPQIWGKMQNALCCTKADLKKEKKMLSFGFGPPLRKCFFFLVIGIPKATQKPLTFLAAFDHNWLSFSPSMKTHHDFRFPNPKMNSSVSMDSFALSHRHHFSSRCQICVTHMPHQYKPEHVLWCQWFTTNY